MPLPMPCAIRDVIDDSLIEVSSLETVAGSGGVSTERVGRRMREQRPTEWKEEMQFWMQKKEGHLRISKYVQVY